MKQFTYTNLGLKYKNLPQVQAEKLESSLAAFGKLYQGPISILGTLTLLNFLRRLGNTSLLRLQADRTLQGNLELNVPLAPTSRPSQNSRVFSPLCRFKYLNNNAQWFLNATAAVRVIGNRTNLLGAILQPNPYSRRALFNFGLTRGSAPAVKVLSTRAWVSIFRRMIKKMKNSVHYAQSGDLRLVDKKWVYRLRYKGPSKRNLGSHRPIHAGHFYRVFKTLSFLKARIRRFAAWKKRMFIWSRVYLYYKTKKWNERVAAGSIMTGGPRSKFRFPSWKRFQRPFQSRRFPRRWIKTSKYKKLKSQRFNWTYYKAGSRNRSIRLRAFKTGLGFEGSIAYTSNPGAVGYRLRKYRNPRKFRCKRFSVRRQALVRVTFKVLKRAILMLKNTKANKKAKAIFKTHAALGARNLVIRALLRVTPRNTINQTGLYRWNFFKLSNFGNSTRALARSWFSATRKEAVATQMMVRAREKYFETKNLYFRHHLSPLYLHNYRVFEKRNTSMSVFDRIMATFALTSKPKVLKQRSLFAIFFNSRGELKTPHLAWRLFKVPSTKKFKKIVYNTKLEQMKYIRARYLKTKRKKSKKKYIKRITLLDALVVNASNSKAAQFRKPRSSKVVRELMAGRRYGGNRALYKFSQSTAPGFIDNLLSGCRPIVGYRSFFNKIGLLCREPVPLYANPPYQNQPVSFSRYKQLGGYYTWSKKPDAKDLPLYFRLLRLKNLARRKYRYDLNSLHMFLPRIQAGTGESELRHVKVTKNRWAAQFPILHNQNRPIKNKPTPVNCFWTENYYSMLVGNVVAFNTKKLHKHDFFIKAMADINTKNSLKFSLLAKSILKLARTPIFQQKTTDSFAQLRVNTFLNFINSKLMTKTETIKSVTARVRSSTIDLFRLQLAFRLPNKPIYLPPYFENAQSSRLKTNQHSSLGTLYEAALLSKVGAQRDALNPYKLLVRLVNYLPRKEQRYLKKLKLIFNYHKLQCGNLPVSRYLKNPLFLSPWKLRYRLGLKPTLKKITTKPQPIYFGNHPKSPKRIDDPVLRLKYRAQTAAKNFAAAKNAIKKPIQKSTIPPAMRHSKSHVPHTNKPPVQYANKMPKAIPNKNTTVFYTNQNPGQHPTLKSRLSGSLTVEEGRLLGLFTPHTYKIEKRWPDYSNPPVLVPQKDNRRSSEQSSKKPANVNSALLNKITAKTDKSLPENTKRTGGGKLPARKKEMSTTNPYKMRTPHWKKS